MIWTLLGSSPQEKKPAFHSRQPSAAALALPPLQLAALNGRKRRGGAARTSETIRIPVGVDRLRGSGALLRPHPTFQVN